MILLALHRLERLVEAQRLVAREDRRIARRLPIAPGENDRIGKRIQLEFFFPNAIVDRKRVGVRVDLQILALARDDAAQQRRDRHVGLRKKQIRPDLRARVAQPFGRNVARLNVGRAVGGDRRLLTRVEQSRAVHVLEAGVGVVIVRRGSGDILELDGRARRRGQ